MNKTIELLKTTLWALNCLPNQRITRTIPRPTDADKAILPKIENTYHLANLIEEHIKELEERPPVITQEMIDNLAQTIREVDGNHDKGAAALAEAILRKWGLQ